MLVPAVLRQSWTKSQYPVRLNFYFMQFIPDPADRIYREFGLFVKSPLPGEAEHLKVDLHLARGRSVMTKLVPSGVAEFTKDEVTIIFKIKFDSELVSGVDCLYLFRLCRLNNSKKCS